MTIRWETGPRRGRIQYEMLGSAYGASTDGDGASGVAVHLANVHAAPIEILEMEFPVRVDRFELIPDSGGPGRFRGGLAIRREYTVLERAGVVRRGDRVRVAPRGLAGGGPGRRAAFVLHPGTDRERATPASGFYVLEPGERFRIESAGGGYGDPRERERERVIADVREGYVSIEGAERDYGMRVG